MERWHILVNPEAGAGLCRAEWPKIEAQLRLHSINANIHFTEHKGHAAALAAQLVKEGGTHLASVGGDGTANEAVNGLFQACRNPADKLLFAHIPVGTGNDWGRTIGIPHRYEDSVKLLAAGKEFVQDCCRVSYVTTEGEPSTRIFVNMAGIGYDAAVCQKTNHDKELGKSGRLLYTKHIFTTLIAHSTAKMSMTADDMTITSPMLSMNIGVCRFNGGGMKQVPHAEPDDGLLSYTLIRDIGRLGILTNSVGLIDGSFVKHPKVTTGSARCIEVATDKPVLLEVDGESLGTGPFMFETMPKCLRVVVK